MTPKPGRLFLSEALPDAKYPAITVEMSWCEDHVGGGISLVDLKQRPGLRSALIDLLL